jgi:asparagine synthase (glutamine-hydrolysing)
MPGLFGVAQRNPGEQLPQNVGDVCTPSSRGCQTESCVDRAGHWAIGRSHLGVLQPGDQLRDGTEVHVLFHGDLHNGGDLESLVDRTAPTGANRAASAIAAFYERDGAGFASRLDGSFCCALIDRARHQAVLVSDLLGSYPIYWTIRDGRLVFASQLRAIPAILGRKPTLNPAAVADYLTFGFPLGVKTLAEGINLLPPGAALVFDWQTGTASVSRYDSIANAFQPWNGTRAEYISEIREAFTAAVERSLSGTHRFGLALSGGLDSRAILSAANGASSSVLTWTLGVKGCADEVIAEQLALASGASHAFFELNDRYLQDFLPNLRRMVALTDGMYLSHGLTEMLAVGFLATTTIQVLLRGHGGELAKTKLAYPLQTDDQIASFTRTDQLVPYLLARGNYLSRSIEWKELFTASWFNRMRDVPRASLEESLAGISLEPMNQCSYLYLHEHHRRFTIASLELFRHVVDIRLPFVDRRFLEVLLRGKPEWRQDTSLHQAMIAGRPALLRIRDSNTGAPVDAGPLAGFLLDRFNSLFRRMHVPGYRHYHDFHRWMRDQLLSSVEAILFAPQSLDRGMLRRDGLRRLVEDTREGRADHGYLLTILLIIELWQQEYQ